MENSVKVKKAGKVILAAVRAVQAVLVLSIAVTLLSSILPGGFFTPRVDKSGEYWYITSFNIFTNAMFLSALWIAARFLGSLKAEESPFTRKNVGRLKKISFLLISVEPVQWIGRAVFDLLRPSSSGGEKTVTVASAGGFLIVLGLIIFCIALVFEYGLDLQKQSDETL